MTARPGIIRKVYNMRKSEIMTILQKKLFSWAACALILSSVSAQAMQGEEDLFTDVTIGKLKEFKDEFLGYDGGGKKYRFWNGGRAFLLGYSSMICDDLDRFDDNLNVSFHWIERQQTWSGHIPNAPQKEDYRYPACYYNYLYIKEEKPQSE
jgi:hypothetical protein